MARELVGTPHLAQAASPPRIAMLPVKNRTRFLIDGEILTVQIQDHMNEFQPGRFAFVARDRMRAIEAERELKRSGDADAAKIAPLAGADFFLAGEMRGIGQAGPGVQSDYVMFHFELIDAETGIKVWTGNYEVRKVGRWSDVYR
jgi:PBP1b-binding outer membrane lipoprotein LpoB